MKNSLWVVPIEPIETRYTKHWYYYLPLQLQENTRYDVQQVSVEVPSVSNTPGAFFNFSSTMAFKARQAEAVAKLFEEGKVKAGDVFLFTDYWNPTAHSVRYMSDLLDIPVKIAGICHAGAWDPADILGQKFKNKTWAHSLESSFDSLYDRKFFATEFCRSLYESSFGHSPTNSVTGFPMEYYDDILTPYWSLDNPPVKEDIVVFPHRKSLEKNLDLFNMLAEALPQYKFVVAMDVCKTKEDYHNLLYRSKLAFSASLQETLGISMGIEALRCGCDVLVPNRLSYAEMAFSGSSKYDGNVANYVVEYGDRTDVDTLAKLIDKKMKSFNPNLYMVKMQHDMNFERFFSSESFYDELDHLS